MQTRTSFNGGELSPEMEARCDVDVFMRGCRTLENWQLNQMGGVKRRRGMRHVCEALGANSRLVSYVYSHATPEEAFLVELTEESIRVLDGDGQEAARFDSGEDEVPEFALDIEEVRTMQLNSMLFLTSRSSFPMVLRRDEDGEWSLSRVKFKSTPWRYDHELRDKAVKVTVEPLVLEGKPIEGERVITVSFDDEEEDSERPVLPGTDEEGNAVDGEADVLRLSYWLEQAEAVESGELLRGSVRVVDGLEACAAGDRVALHGDTTLRYWVCKQEFPSEVYVPGLDDPGCYPSNFEESENVSGFSGVAVVTSVSQLGNVAKNTKFAVRSGYWEYYTCIRDFSESDMVAGQTKYSDYTGFFVRGIPVGQPLPCQGKWNFYCSGLWYGSYEVRRSFEGNELSAEWETAGISFSRVSEAENVQLAGDEAGEECWLRLFLTRSKYMTAALADGFPPDSCGNRLIVEGYRHDMVLELDPYGVWRSAEKIKPEWFGSRHVKDWSWQAFSERYGYPLQAAVYAQRLVFASTLHQPQSLWLSQVDDYYNFLTGDADNTAIYVTLMSNTQDPICWMLQYRSMLMLGTSSAEWCIQPRDGVVRPGGLEVSQHGRVGSQEGLMLAVEDKALYVQRGSGRLFEFGYSFEVDGCRSKDLTVFAPHIFTTHGGAQQGALLAVPDTVAVFVLGDGQLALMTYNVLHQVNAWHRWVTEGKVRSVCALPGTHGDRLFLIVQRGFVNNIEVVDEASPYEDAGGRKYTSTLVTSALGNALEEPQVKRPKLPAMLLLGNEVETAHLEVCANGGTWSQVATNSPSLAPGWLQVLTCNKWEVGHAIGLRYDGGACSFLALQG